MTLREIMEELSQHVRDETLRDIFFKKWINDAVLGLAEEFQLPALKLLEPHNMPVNSSTWLHALPETFHKELFKCRSVDWGRVGILSSVSALDELDPDHDEVEATVRFVAVSEEHRNLAIFPKADTTVRLWFYRKPEVLDSEEDRLTCIPEAYQRRVLIPKVIVDAFPMIQDMAVQPPGPSIGYWRTKYSEGLFGSPKGEIGMIPYLAARNAPRVHLGRGLG